MPDPALPGRAAGVPRPLRWALLALGWLCVGLGIAGLVLPLVPGVVFFILAGACFARSSPRFEAWLLNHRILGPPVADWRRRGAIPRSAKVVACLSMAGSFGLITLTQAPVSVKAGLAVALLGCGLYVATRPEI